MKVLIVLPTYNERQNIERVISLILTTCSNCDLLVVDDNSPDKTAEVVEKISNQEKRVNLLVRAKKQGLGTAYVAGFQWGLARGYDLFFEMDSDLSHDPADLPRFIEKIKSGCDLVIGSRYTNNTISVVGWDFKRLLISKFANWYATTILKTKNLTDITSGFRAYTRSCLERIDLQSIKSNGYAFQIEMAYKVIKEGLTVCELPIIFYERAGGSSKMSKKIALEAAIMVWRLRFGR